ncbi:transcriptional regulator, MerR family [Geoalkalibacter ferrihydriticus]|uniref:MerR family transcriptional regulator n=2 Tax=Geoalkalibacter ferrihydriticus TaxID=392333 RepID=A0A0C2HRA9_9BACT|nr:MerR family transcriptional regulator [Geoalkalibacter ferrihydriticus]KIH77400.1 MerR family transcriptional regulator [Geoalkalibacter ferrihydriticus DSM 17813]SDM16638.1 transcriptional regulator, MerR family [Geoalkalibacter ferrihydriticus]
MIPDKLYFKIGEVSRITGVKPHVLRYWESEFGSFSPIKSRTQQRLYQRKDIELVLRLKQLLYEEGFTIAGARKKLREERAETAQPSLEFFAPPPDLLSEIRQDLKVLRDSLCSPKIPRRDD